jgi:hypothetical protein
MVGKGNDNLPANRKGDTISLYQSFWKSIKGPSSG